jgi:putative transposase
LAVLDGSKALAKAVRDVFGARALLQRCQVHKMRNILDQLPEEMRPSIREALRQAYRAGNADRAKKLLLNLARRIRVEHPSAAGSIDEGLDETLTVMRFGLPSSLARVLSTTNVIENIIGSVRHLGGRVKRWNERSDDPALDHRRRVRRGDPLPFHRRPQVDARPGEDPAGARPRHFTR